MRKFNQSCQQQPIRWLGREALLSEDAGGRGRRCDHAVCVPYSRRFRHDTCTARSPISMAILFILHLNKMMPPLQSRSSKESGAQNRSCATLK